MQLIPLIPVPNQTFSVRLDGALFDVTLKTARERMTITITRDTVELIAGARCRPNLPLIPYGYQEGITGNFFFRTQNDVYPHYSRFGGTDALYYLTRPELEALRHG